MNRRLATRWLHTLAPAGLAVALLVLAFLQYRWIGEISRADRERLQRNLRHSADRFRNAFSRELGVLARRFSVPAQVVEQRDWAAIAKTYAGWRANPDAFVEVARVLVWEVAEDDGAVRILELDPDTLEARPVAWPPALRELDPQRSGRLAARRLAPRGIGWSFHAPSATLIQPLILLPRDGARRLPRPSFRGALLVQLNPDFLRDELFPALEARFLADAAGPSYTIRIALAGGRDRVREIVYASDAAARARPPSDPELAMPLLPDRSDRERAREFRDRLARVRQPNGRSLEFRELSPIAAAGLGGEWFLLAEYRAGTLDEVVDRLRTRNLAISSGILLLLAAGLALILVSSRRAERLARLQMEFVAGVSHELRTPLAVIRSAGDNLAEGVVRSAEQVREYGSLIRDEGRRLSGMVEQTLAFSAEQSGRRRYQVERVDTAEWLNKALDEVRPAIEAQRFTVEQDLPDNLPAVLIDPAAARQSLHNLIQNALKYGREAGWIGLSARPHDGYVRVTVADRGIGIDAADLPHIFEPFYRGRRASERQMEGAGLGLSLASRAVEAFGGRLSVQSQVELGSRFFLDLPIAETSQ